MGLLLSHATLMIAIVWQSQMGLYLSHATLLSWHALRRTLHSPHWSHLRWVCHTFLPYLFANPVYMTHGSRVMQVYTRLQLVHVVALSLAFNLLAAMMFLDRSHCNHVAITECWARSP